MNASKKDKLTTEFELRVLSLGIVLVSVCGHLCSLGGVVMAIHQVERNRLQGWLNIASTIETGSLATDIRSAAKLHIHCWGLNGLCVDC